MSWYRTGTVVVTNGSKNVTGVGTLWTTAVNAGDAFALVDANLNPTGAWYEVEEVTSNTALVLKQSYAGTTGSNKQYCVFNLVGNMTTPSFAQRLATFFASFQSLIDKPTTTPTASSIPIADANGDIDSGWIKDATASVKGVVELATSAETTTATDTTRAVTPAGFIAGLRGNILGTVSQSGGIPTGAVIERGSNANGEYVKFADGTAICKKIMTWEGTETYRPTTTLPITITSAMHMCEFAIPASETSFLVCTVNYVTASTVYYWVQQVSSTGTVTKRTGAHAFNIFIFGRWF